jgi:hypothetical protein
VIARLHGTHLHRRLAHFLHDEGDRAPFPIIVADRQRNTLTLFIDPNDDKLAGLGLSCHYGRLDLKKLGHGGQVFFDQDFVHAYASSHIRVPAPQQ